MGNLCENCMCGAGNEHKQKACTTCKENLCFKGDSDWEKPCDCECHKEKTFGNVIKTDIHTKIANLVLPALHSAYAVGMIRGEEYGIGVIGELEKLFHKWNQENIDLALNARDAENKVAGTERVNRGGCRVAGCTAHPMNTPLSDNGKWCYCFKYRTEGKCNHLNSPHN